MADGDTPGSARTKRSQSVSTVLVASAGLAALGLGSLDRTAPLREVLVYVDAAACAAEGIRPADECRSEYAAARAAYPSTAPHYGSPTECEQHHGLSRCLLDPDMQQLVPRMAGYLIGRRASDGVTPEPVYEHAQGHGGGHGESYCTGTGGKVSTGSGGHASSGTLKSGTGHATKFGGFGSSGKRFSSFGGT